VGDHRRHRHQIKGFRGGEARRSGGDTSNLELGGNGVIYAEDGALLLRLDRNRLEPAITFAQQIAGE
jgi:hypothetical protein